MSRPIIGSPDAMDASPPTSPPDEELEADEVTRDFDREPEEPDRDEALEWGGVEYPQPL